MRDRKSHKRGQLNTEKISPDFFTVFPSTFLKARCPFKKIENILSDLLSCRQSLFVNIHVRRGRREHHGAYISEGLPGDPKGLKAVRPMFLDLQNSTMSL